MKTYSKIICLLALVIPSLTHAQSLSKLTNVNSVVVRLLAIGDVFIYFLVSLAVVYIVWSVVHYLIRPTGDKREGGLNILYGIIGLFVILSIWGLVNILLNSFGTNSNVPTNRLPSANFISPPAQDTVTETIQYQAPSKANNYNTNITGGNENTQNYNH